MAFDILINTSDAYLFSLIKTQLMRVFTDAYIRMSSDSTNNNLSSFTTVIYDNSVVQSSPNANYIPLYSTYNNHKYIDCDVLTEKVMELRDSQQIDVADSNSEVNPRISILIPFVYPADREFFIENKLTSMITSNCMCIRMNFVWGTHLTSANHSGIVSGAMTSLLNKAKAEIKPMEILDYLTPDNQGFLNPGPTDKPDDIWDASDQAISNLLTATNQLLISENGNFDCLMVVDSYRTKDLIKFVPFAKELILLLPDKNLINQEAIDDLIKTLSKQLNPLSTLSIFYSNESKES